MGTELALIGLSIARLIRDLYVDGVATGVFRDVDPDEAVDLIGQQIYGAMTVRAGEPLPPTGRRGGRREPVRSSCGVWGSERPVGHRRPCLGR